MGRERLSKARVHSIESETDDSALPAELTAEPQTRHHRVDAMTASQAFSS